MFILLLFASAIQSLLTFLQFFGSVLVSPLPVNPEAPTPILGVSGIVSRSLVSRGHFWIIFVQNSFHICFILQLSYLPIHWQRYTFYWFLVTSASPLRTLAFDCFSFVHLCSPHSFILVTLSASGAAFFDLFSSSSSLPSFNRITLWTKIFGLSSRWAAHLCCCKLRWTSSPCSPSYFWSFLVVFKY